MHKESNKRVQACAVGVFPHPHLYNLKILLSIILAVYLPKQRIMHGHYPGG